MPDSNIILMMGDDMACNARNPYPAQIFNNESHTLNLYDSTVLVDYKGYEVTVENLIRVLTGRHDPSVPRSKRMLSDSGSNILLFMTGHGGDEFIKFQDVEELMARDLGEALQQMHEKGRYNEMLVMIETCEAGTLISRLTAPNVIAVASSIKGESSFSYMNDFDMGQPVVDRFTRRTLEFCEQLSINSDATLPQLFQMYGYDVMESTFNYRTIGLRRPLSHVQLLDFMGSVSQVHMVEQAYDMDPATEQLESHAGRQSCEAGRGCSGQDMPQQVHSNAAGEYNRLSEDHQKQQHPRKQQIQQRLKGATQRVASLLAKHAFGHFT